MIKSKPQLFRLIKVGQSVAFGLLGLFIFTRTSAQTAAPAAEAGRDRGTIARLAALCEVQISFARLAVSKSGDASVVNNATNVISADGSVLSGLRGISAAAMLPDDPPSTVPAYVLDQLTDLDAVTFNKVVQQKLLDSQLLFLRELKQRALLSGNPQLSAFAGALISPVEQAVAASENIYDAL